MTDNVAYAAASDAARYANKERIEHLSSHEAALAATQDAVRLAATDPSERTTLQNVPSVNLDSVTRAEASIIESEEHRALGYRPPPGSLAAAAKSAADARSGEEGRGTQRTTVLKEAARADAAIVAAQDGDVVGLVPTVDLDGITKEEAARLQSEEHKKLGHRPPPGSLAAMAQSAADRNESGGNRINGGPAGIDLNKIDQEDANRLMSEEHRRLGHRPPADSLAAQAQAAVSARS